jgi:hypothetical protein
MKEVSEEIISRRSSEIEALYSLARTLNTGLDRRALALLLELLEIGVHPDSLVDGKKTLSSYMHLTMIFTSLNYPVFAAVEELRQPR